MTAFARPSLLDNRYAVIAETSIYTYDDDDLVNYAEFLRNHGRYKTKDGFVDSSRRVRSLHRQQGDLQNSSSRTGGLLASISKSTSLSAPATTSKRSDRHTSKSAENKTRDYDKQMKIIEEEMIKAKQSEREAKRLEGDIKKEQRYLHHALRNLDVDATRKRYNSEKNLSKNLEEKDRIERELVKKREKQTKQRTERKVDSLQASKDKDRRNLLVCNDLARQYRTKSNELNVKHQQLGHIHSEFEQKVQQKELEESRLKKELANIAMALNLEAQKVKTEMGDFLALVDYDRNQTLKFSSDQDLRYAQTNAQGRNFEQERRRHSGDLSHQRSVLDAKQRDALHRIGDTKSRLDTIYAKQRQLNASTSVADHERRLKHLASKMTDVDNGRSQFSTLHSRDKSEDHDLEQTNRSLTRHTELETKRHEDHLRRLENLISQKEEVEYELRKSVKEAEFLRRKKEQEVQRLKTDIIRKKREDARIIQEAIHRSENEEKQIARSLAKEKTKLNRLQTRREGNHQRLTHQQAFTNENKQLLQTHEREHERLLSAQFKSQSTQSLNINTS